MRNIISLLTVAFMASLVLAETPGLQREYEDDQFLRRRCGTLMTGDIAKWTPEMKQRFDKENPGFIDWDGTCHRPVNPNLPAAEQKAMRDRKEGRIEGVKGVQLADYTSKGDVAGMFWYIAMLWVISPMIIFALLGADGTRPIGLFFLAVWLMIAIPRWIEFFALFVVLPAIIAIGFLKGLISALK